MFKVYMDYVHQGVTRSYTTENADNIYNLRHSYYMINDVESATRSPNSLADVTGVEVVHGRVGKGDHVEQTAPAPRDLTHLTQPAVTRGHARTSDETINKSDQSRV